MNTISPTLSSNPTINTIVVNTRAVYDVVAGAFYTDPVLRGWWFQLSGAQHQAVVSAYIRAAMAIDDPYGTLSPARIELDTLIKDSMISLQWNEQVIAATHQALVESIVLRDPNQVMDTLVNYRIANQALDTVVLEHVNARTRNQPETRL